MRRQKSSNRRNIFQLIAGNKKGESGLTSAIILIAFVIVAASIAFVILSLGGDFISRTRDTGDTALEQTGSAIQVVGTVIGLDIFNNTDGTVTANQQIDSLLVKVQLSATATSDVDLGSSAITVEFSTTSIVQVMTYNADLNAEYTTLTATELTQDAYEYGLREIRGDGDQVLEATEQFEFVVFFSGGELDTSTEFNLGFQPSVGNELSVERTTPTQINVVNDL